jgi:hypothetical protein
VQTSTRPPSITLSDEEIDAIVVACRAMANQIRGSSHHESDPRLRKLSRESATRYERLAIRVARARPQGHRLALKRGEAPAPKEEAG